MTEKEYWLTCAGDEDFLRMSMPESVMNLSARCWRRLRYFDEPELSLDNPAVRLSVEAIGFDWDLFAAHVFAMSRLQQADFDERLKEMALYSFDLKFA